MHLIAVPRQDNKTQPYNPAKYVEFEKLLGALFGGYTRTEAVGGWVSGDGSLVREPILQYICYADDDLGNQCKLAVNHIFPDQEEPGVYVTGPYSD